MKAEGGFSKRTMRRRKGKPPNHSLVQAVLKIIPKNKTVIDLGAGEGRFVRALNENGLTVVGVDGSESIEEVSEGQVLFQDLTGDCSNLTGRFNWGLFIEVGEHVDALEEDLLIRNVASIPLEGLIVSWATPGQRGRGHINCRTTEYVASYFGGVGWVLDELLTKSARDITDRHFKNKIMVFKRT